MTQPSPVRMTLAALEVLATEGRLEAACRGLEALVATRVHDVGDHGPCGELAQTLGLTRIAERELRLAIRDARGTPDEALWSKALANLQRDLGDTTKEARTLGRLVKLGVAEAASVTHPIEPELSAETLVVPRPERKVDPAPSQPSPSGRATVPTPQLPEPSRADLTRFLHLFQGREDVHARQWIAPDGRVGYAPVRSPLTREALERHLAGTETLGVYATRADLTACFFAIDIDLTRPALDEARRSVDATRRLRRALHDETLRMVALARSLGLDLVPEDSGYKGRHLWGFLAEPMPVGMLRNLARALGRTLLPESSDLAIECFPKQARLEPGQIGNLIKLPLGVHLKTGRRAWILDAEGKPARDPWDVLKRARRHGREEILDAMARMRQPLGPDQLAPAADAPKPAGLQPGPGFVQADFQTDPELRVLLGGCPVLRVLVERGLELRRLDHPAQNVLRHVLGYRPIGLLAANYVFRRCPEVPVSAHLQSMLAGNPMSCAKIRKSVPDVTAHVPCNCVFKVRTDHYPTPLLHLDEARARGLLPERSAVDERPEPRVAEDWARKVAHTREQLVRIQSELAAAERKLVDELGRLDGGRLILPEGEWTLDSQGRLGWSPKP